MISHLNSFLAGFWLLWLVVGGRTAWGQWRSSIGRPTGTRAMRALGAFFCWPAWLWRVFG